MRPTVAIGKYFSHYTSRPILQGEPKKIFTGRFVGIFAVNWLLKIPPLQREDTAVMARLESARGQGRLPRRPSARHSRRHLGHRSRPRCCHRP